jgi:hypothetical protein
VNVEYKQTGAEHRTTVDRSVSAERNTKSSGREDSGNQITSAGSLASAETLTKAVLGDSARLREAMTDSGTYRGPVIGETELHIIQRQSAHLAVAHRKDALDQQPGTGSNVAINYSNGKALVRQVHDRARAQELGR